LLPSNSSKAFTVYFTEGKITYAISLITLFGFFRGGILDSESIEWKRKSLIRYWESELRKTIPGTPEGEAAYQRYRKSTTWLEIREHALIRSKRKCEGCGISNSKLDVHHDNYERVGGNELPQDLLVLCPDCHAKAELRRKRIIESDNDEALFASRMIGFAKKILNGDNLPGDEEELFLNYLYKNNLPQLEEEYEDQYILGPELDSADDFYYEFKRRVMNKDY
jgi:hypothetical protein